MFGRLHGLHSQVSISEAFPGACQYTHGVAYSNSGNFAILKAYVKKALHYYMDMCGTLKLK